jgi:hypothetical protein
MDASILNKLRHENLMGVVTLYAESK